MHTCNFPLRSSYHVPDNHGKGEKEPFLDSEIGEFKRLGSAEKQNRIDRNRTQR